MGQFTSVTSSYQKLDFSGLKIFSSSENRILALTFDRSYNSIRNQLVAWIRIGIRNADTDPGDLKRAQMKKKKRS
jgi:hypothetical protein